MTQDEVNELCGPRDDAARVMLKALYEVQDDYRELLRNGPDNTEAEEIDGMLQIVDGAIRQAEAAGITTGEK